MTELWRDVVGFEGFYQVSNHGRVKSLDRQVFYIDGRVRTFYGQILKLRLDSKGYYFVTLIKPGFKIQQRVHRLVAESFILNFQNKPCVNHKNSNRKDNIVDNLEWVTHKENTQHAIKKGLLYKPGKKLDVEKINLIKKMYNSGTFTQQGLANIFSLSQSQISRIVGGKNWK